MARTSKKQQAKKLWDSAQKSFSVGIYARLSVDSHSEKNESIETQIEIAKRFMEEQPALKLYDCYFDLGKTGTNFERPGFNRLMSDIRSRRVNCVIVKDFSRFGRNYIETGNYIEKIFPFLEVRFIAVTDGFDSYSMQNDDFAVHLKNLANALYAKDIAVKVKSTRMRQWENGSYTGGTAPYGYEVSRIDGRRCLVIEEDTARIVKEIFAQYESGKSYKALAAWLFKNKVHRPAEYHKYKHPYAYEAEELVEWSRGTIKAILSNPVYMGCLVRGSRYKEENIKENMHESIISRELYFRVADRLECQTKYCNKNGFSKLHPPTEDIFDGILYCGACGHKMKRISYIKECGNGEKFRKFAYKCPNSDRIDFKKCQNHTILFETLLQLVKEPLKKEFMLAGICEEEMILILKNQFKQENYKLQKQFDSIEKEIDRCKKLRSEQYLKYRANSLSLQAFEGRQKENERQMQVLSERLARVKTEQAKKQLVLNKKEVCLHSLLQWNEDAVIDKALLQLMIHKMTVFCDRRVEILFHFQNNNFDM